MKKKKDPNQRSFDWTGGDAKREALERVERNASQEWKDEAWEILLRVAKSRETLTTDDLWDAGLSGAHENRALGPIMLRGARERIIEKVEGGWRVARRVTAHERPMKIWRSRIWQRVPL